MNKLSKIAVCGFVALSMLAGGCGPVPSSDSPSSHNYKTSSVAAASSEILTDDKGITPEEVAAIKAFNIKPVEVLPIDPSIIKSQPIFDYIVGSDLTVYLRDAEDNTFFSESYGNNRIRFIDVIVNSQTTDKAWRIGQIKTTEYYYGSISVIDEKTLCYNNGDQLSFIDLEQGKNTGFNLDFQTPFEPNWRFGSVVYDPAKKEYVLIYTVSSYVSTNGVFRSWMMYDSSELGAPDAHLEFQRFSADGKFIDKHITAIKPQIQCTFQPNQYYNNLLSFKGNYQCFTYDFKTKTEKEMLYTMAAFDGSTAILCNEDYSHDNETYSYKYDWYENNQWKGTVTLLAYNNLILDEYTQSLAIHIAQKNIDKKTFTLQCGFIGTSFHELDFAASKGVQVYKYSADRLKDVVCTSADGRYQIYFIDIVPKVNYYKKEIVSLDTQTGKCERLRLLSDIYNLTGKYQLVSWSDFLTFSVFDLTTRQNISPISEFDKKYSELKDGDQVCVGLEYDLENDLLLVLCTAFYNQDAVNFSDSLWKNCFLRVYTSDWKLLRTIDTGIKAHGGGANYFPNGLGMELDGKGSVVFNNGQKQLNYLK